MLHFTGCKMYKFTLRRRRQTSDDDDVKPKRRGDAASVAHYVMHTRDAFLSRIRCRRRRRHRKRPNAIPSADPLLYVCTLRNLLHAKRSSHTLTDCLSDSRCYVILLFAPRRRVTPRNRDRVSWMVDVGKTTHATRDLLRVLKSRTNDPSS